MSHVIIYESSKAQEVLFGLLLRCEYCNILIIKTHSLTGRPWESTFITPNENRAQARKIIPGNINGIPALALRCDGMCV